MKAKGNAVFTAHVRIECSGDIGAEQLKRLLHRALINEDATLRAAGIREAIIDDVHEGAKFTTQNLNEIAHGRKA